MGLQKTKKKMALKIIISIILLAGLQFIFKSFSTHRTKAETPVDKAWWDGLSAEWKNILLINQNFKNQRSDIFALQREYINRMNAQNEDDYSEMNKSLHELNEIRKFSLGYTDLYARALRYKFVIHNDSIDLATLQDLDMIYLVNGPGDLTPLKKFPNLKILILNGCGIGNSISMNHQPLNLEPLRYLKKLQVLQCSSVALQSIEPIKGLGDLQELNIDNSSVTDLSPLKTLVNLEVLSVGDEVETATVISQLINLKALFIKGCKQIPDLSNLTRLKKLSIGENELSVIDGNYRITSIGFLKNLSALEFLDLDNTSFKGSLNVTNTLQNLKAITLPAVNTASMQEFKKNHKNCIIINAFQYER